MKKRMKRVACLAAVVLAVLFLGLPSPALADGVSWTRLMGSSRYDTMAEIVGEGFSTSTRAVVVSGENFPDALAASTLAGTYQCPVVLTKPDGLSARARSTLVRLGARNVTLVGGTSALSDVVERDVRGLGVRVERVAGASRQETAVRVLDAVRKGGSLSNTVVVASGEGFADALSISPWAYAQRAPILLTRADGTLGDDALAAIRDAGFAHVVVVGGTSVVSEAVEGQLPASVEVVRIGGQNRYETSAGVAAWEMGQGFTLRQPTIASGQNFPDALAASALAGKCASPILLANTSVDASIDLLRGNRASLEHGYLVGGYRAVPFYDPFEPVPAGTSNSELVTYTHLSPNHSGARLAPIMVLTPHFMGDELLTVESTGELFSRPERQASSNYGIDSDGQVGLYVYEANRAWTSSSGDNDNSAVTIECANEADGSLTPATWDALVRLMADICRRNGIRQLNFTGDPTGNLTFHKMFNPKTDCPGLWLEPRFPQLAEEVNAPLR